jgi:hypothetical protein
MGESLGRGLFKPIISTQSSYSPYLDFNNSGLWFFSYELAFNCPGGIASAMMALRRTYLLERRSPLPGKGKGRTIKGIDSPNDNCEYGAILSNTRERVKKITT